MEEVVQTIIEAREKQWNGELGGAPSRTQLWCCVNRYVRRDVKPNNKGTARGKPLTLFFAHANGFPKEVSAYNLVFWLVINIYDRYGSLP